MKPQQFTIPQQFMVGDIKIDTKAQLGRKYTRLLIDAFVPYEEAMLAYLDELIVKHDPQLVEKQLNLVKSKNRTGRNQGNGSKSCSCLSKQIHPNMKT